MSQSIDYPLEDFREWLRERKRYTDATISQYLSGARCYRRHLADGEPSLEQYREWLRDLKDGARKPSSVNTYHSHAKTYCDYLGVDFDPSNAAGELPDYDPNSLPDPLTRDEVGAFREASEDPEEEAIIVLLYHTALRNSELRDIKWGDVDERTGDLTVRRRKKRGWSMDALPLYDDQIETIKALRDYRDDDNEYLFPAYDGPVAPGSTVSKVSDSGNMCGQTLRQRVSDIVSRSPVERHVWPHLFRHTRATHLLEETSDLDYVNQWCDHDNYETTLRYARLTGANLRREDAADSSGTFG